MGDLVCLHKDNVVPVSWVRLAQTPRSWGRAASLLGFLLCTPLPQCSLLPSPPHPHPRPTCSCWPARSPAVCATWRPQTSTGEAQLITRGSGAWEPARPSPTATECGSPSPRGYCGHSPWEHLWGTAKQQGARTFSQRKGPTFSAPALLEALLCSRCGRLKPRSLRHSTNVLRECGQGPSASRWASEPQEGLRGNV